MQHRRTPSAKAQGAMVRISHQLLECGSNTQGGTYMPRESTVVTVIAEQACAQKIERVIPKNAGAIPIGIFVSHGDGRLSAAADEPSISIPTIPRHRRHRVGLGQYLLDILARNRQIHSNV